MQIHYGFNSSTDLKWEREGKEIRMEDKIFVRALFAFFSSRLLLRSPIGTANIKGTDDSVLSRMWSNLFSCTAGGSIDW